MGEYKADLPRRVLATLEKYGGWQATLDHIASLEAIAEAAEDLRADAMRYAWLRHKLTCGHLSVSEEVAITMAKSPEQLDAAIDAALSTVVPVREG